MKIGNLDIKKEKLAIAVVFSALLLGGGVYMLFYVPLISKLKSETRQVRSIENELKELRSMLDTTGKVYEERTLISGKDVSRAINELTKQADLKSVNFISISPGDIRKDATCRVMPIEIKAECTYKQLGILLGSLDELEKGLVRVNSLDVAVSPKDPKKVISDIILDMYISKNE